MPNLPLFALWGRIGPNQREHTVVRNDMVEYVVLDGPGAQPSDIETFIRVVQTGGAVDEHYVRRGIRRSGAKLLLARMGNEVVGVAALKIPMQSYRNGIESKEKSGYPLPLAQFPYELGYVAVSQACGGRGIAGALIEKVIEQAERHGLFATTFNAAMKDTLLPRAGFERVGTSWLNGESERLHLFVLYHQSRTSRT